MYCRSVARAQLSFVTLCKYFIYLKAARNKFVPFFLTKSTL